MGVEIYISNNKELYSHIFNNKEKIESELGESLEWMELPNKKASRIKSSAIGDFENENKWNDYFEWLLKEAERFQAIFPKYINS